MFAFVLLIIPVGCIQNGPEIPSDVIGAKTPDFEGRPILEAVTASSALVTATVTKENGYKITERGFFYGTTESPSEENGATKLIDTNMDTEKRTGSYTLTINNLKNNTKYYIRPYAINAIGTGSTPDLEFITIEGIAIIETIKPDTALIRASTAVTGIKITSSGEGVIEKAGIYYYEKDHIEKTDSSIYVTSYPFSVSQGDSLICQLKDLTPDTEYYVQAFLVSTYGTTRGGLESLKTWDGKPVIGNTEREERGYTEIKMASSVSNGGDETVLIAECGFCWAVSSETTNPDISNNFESFGNSVGPFAGTIKGLTSNTLYSLRAYAKSNLGIIVYGEVIEVRTITDVPTVITEDVTIDGGNAIVKGLLDDEGEYPVTASGICWSRSHQTPEIGVDSTLYLVAGVDSVFSGQLTGLRGGITYYVRAFATNAKGTAYGDVKSFQTPPIFTTGLRELGGFARFNNSTAYFAIQHNLYILGGDLGPSCTNEFSRYAIETDNWDALLGFTGGPAKWQFGITYGNGAYVYGGYNSSGNETAGIYYYDPNQNRWFYYDGPDSTVIHSTIGYAQMNHIYFVGGQSGDTVRQDVWSFEAPVKVWEKKTDFPVKQYGGVAAVINGVVYVGLGKDENDICNGTLWTTTDGAVSWDFKSYHDQINRNVFGGVACNGRLYVVADESESDYYILEYSPDTDKWTRKSRLPAGHVAFHCIYMVNNKIYIGMGGRSMMVYDPLWDNE